MLEITIATEPSAFKFTQERTGGKPIEWEVSVMPADGTSRVKLSAEFASTYYYELGLRSVRSIVRADCGGPVGVNGKPATDDSVRALVLRNFIALTVACGHEAERLGEVVEVERGN